MRYLKKLLIGVASMAMASGIAYGHVAKSKSCCSPTQTSEVSKETAREKVLLLLSGEWVTRCTYVATKLEIADLLARGPRSVDEMAVLTNSNADALNRVLRVLASFGVFEEVSPGVFANNDVSALLAKSNPDTLYNLSIFYGQVIHPTWDELYRCVQSGIPAFEYVFKEPVFGHFNNNVEAGLIFNDAMRDISTIVIKSSLESYPFGKFQSVYDIGGGYGHMVQALLAKYPSMKGLVYDLPEVIDAIKANNPSLDTSRCELKAGSFFDSIPTGGDAYLLKSIVHDWEDKKAEQILRNCHKAMDQDSRLLLIEVVILPKDQSKYANCLDVAMLAITGGRERTVEDFRELLDDTGFVLEGIYPSSTEYSVIQARKK